ncbi:hypothetical protein E8E14_000005, partial [Neopestalotiopsis sp. 37M]
AEATKEIMEKSKLPEDIEKMAYELAIPALVYCPNMGYSLFRLLFSTILHLIFPLCFGDTLLNKYGDVPSPKTQKKAARKWRGRIPFRKSIKNTGSICQKRKSLELEPGDYVDNPLPVKRPHQEFLSELHTNPADTIDADFTGQEGANNVFALFEDSQEEGEPGHLLTESTPCGYVVFTPSSILMASG